MAGPTLLEVVERRFGVPVDPDSDGGHILGSLRPRAPFDDPALSGQADAAPLAFGMTPGGISVAASAAVDALVLRLPAGPVDFRMIPPGAANPAPQVELKLLSPAVPVPFLRPAQVGPDGTLQPATGGVELQLPDLLLVVTATVGAPAGARLAPSHEAAGELVATMTPPSVLLGPGTVVALTFDRLILRLDDPAGPAIDAPVIEVHVNPPGLPALAMRGAGRDLHLGLAVGDGLSGTFDLASGEGGPGAAALPRFVHGVAAQLRLDRNTVTRLELTGSIDAAGAVAARVGPLGDPAAEIDFSLRLTLDAGWRAALSLRASGGGDHLWRTRRQAADAQDIARDTLGAFAVFAPLLAPGPPVASAAGYADLAIAAGAAAGVAATDALTTQSIVLHGAELVVRQPDGAPPEAFLFLDLETELSLSVRLGDVELLASQRPIKVRHRALGLRLDFGPAGSSPQLRPVFDPAQGFSVDLSDPGILRVPGQLGDIVQPTAARIARDNPLQLEVDLALKADLGIVSVDGASVRIPLDPPGAPTLTALGAHVDVPGAVSGSGYLRLEPSGGFAGRLDVALAPPLGLRASAGLAIRHVRDPRTNEELDAVLVTLALELPVPIPLANSGLGLFGFLGLLGVHHERDQAPRQTALDWFLRAGGDATRVEAWKASAHRWAIGLGAVIGTVEGGFLFHAKGMLVIELPGPRVILVMNADFLAGRPPTHGPPDTGRLLAVIEIRPESVTVGVIADYGITPLLELRVPAEAFFDLRRAEGWHLDIGGIPPRLPVSVRFLSSIRADGYLLIHGDGIPDFPLRPLQGFSVAAGIRAAFTWGPEEIGLYLRITAQADLGISFKPMLVIGRMELRGELHLFVVSVEASAAATVVITPDTFWISAEVCGSVDFVFFDVSACVSLELGSKPTRLPPADPLIRAMSLHSRAPTLVRGSVSGAPVDGSLGDAAHPDVEPGAWPVVPIDAIPVLQLEMRPAVDPACAFLGQGVPPKLPPDGWLRRGERFYRYTLRSLVLAGVKADGAALASPVTDGQAPTVWWDRHSTPSAGDDNDVQLALLSWIPDPTPAAAERTTSLDERVRRRWGDLCLEVAPPAPVMWSFEHAPAGPSPTGWTLAGIPLPDEPGFVRSAAPPGSARALEPWRSGSSLVDGLAHQLPAYVFAAEDLPGRLLIAPRTGLDLQPAIPDDADFVDLFDELVQPAGDRLGDAVRLDTGGLAAVRLLLFVAGAVGTEGSLVLRPLDGDGNPTGSDQPVEPPRAQQPTPANLPPEWLDPSGPWRPIIGAASDAWARYRRAWDADVALVLMTADLPEGTTQVEIGLVRDVTPQHASWGLLVFDGITRAELLRFRFDTEDRDRRIDVVNGALGADQATRALLHPGATYTLTARYDVEVAPADGSGNPVVTEAEKTAGLEQRFRFRTDDKPPQRLDPWVMSTAPGPSEPFFFHGEPLRVVFSTNATRRLFAAYGRSLFAVAKAASGNHPQAAAAFEGLPAFVRTPFEGALLEALADAPCVGAGQSDRHERLTVNLPLEPMTDYILDIEADPPAAPPPYPLFRRHFSTSRYASMHALAAHVAATPIAHRAVPDPLPLVSLAARSPGSPALPVTDLELEQVLRALRWGDLARLAGPRVTVIWGVSPPVTSHRAIALLLETPEPLWRWRDVPTQVTDPAGTRRWELRRQPWLDVVDTPAGSLPVTRFIHSTDGARTLVMLSPVIFLNGSVSLSLRRSRHPLFEGDAGFETAPLVTTRLAVLPPWGAGA